MRNKVSNSRILSVLLIVFWGVFFAGICDAATQVAPAATISDVDVVPEEYVDSGEDVRSVANQELKIMDQENPVEECRDAIHKNRLYREAYDVLYPWTLDSKNTDKESLLEGINLTNTCLLNLGRYDEQSAYYEKLLEVHAQNWMVHQTVANLYQSIPHFGVLIDNEFYRGMDPGNGPQYSAAQHDIVRGMQIMRQAMPLVEQAAQDPRERGKITSFYLGYAERFYSDAWKMQILTDMETLPEPEMMEYDYARRGNPGAPVDEAGNPVFFALPESFETAQNDGERWRYLLNRAMEYDDSVRCLIYRRIADFSIQYFGVETLTHYNYFSSRDTVTADNDDKNGIWSLASLSDSETIARLANGVKRFELPDDYNYIRLYEQVLEIGDVWNKYQARETLARIYMNRRQYDRAAEYYKAIIDNWDEKAQGKKNRRNGQYEQIQRKYEQITGNWGRFEPMESKVAGTDVTLSWRFRNGSKVSFTAQKVEVVKLWQDIEDYLKKHEKELANKLDYQRIGCWERIGYDLVTDSEVRGKYLGGEVANWSVDLDPPAGHYDALTAIDFPVKEAGMYLVTATMENGNTNHIIVNLNDMAIVRKPIDKAQYFYVADAKTGKPVPNAKLHLFGYGQKEKKRLIRDNDYILVTRELNGTTDQHGQYFLKYSKNNPEEINDYAWYATATDEAGKRFAVLGFQHIWYPYKYDSEYHNVRAYFVSDRPVYRPEQTVEFKFWVGTSKYDMPETCEWAERTVWLQVSDPRGNKLIDKKVTLDKYGGVADKLKLPEDAVLGVYNFVLLKDKESEYLGSGSIRIEEYRKPEYEVKIDAPTEPVQLGDSFKAKITARYYFGAPVQNAKVRYTVTREKKNTDWYPIRPWDWFYGNGYWWFGYDYDWYPGWKKWGCLRPCPIWSPRWGQMPPEVVLEQTVDIGDDGTVEVEIDSSLAKAIFPDDDQQYTITAEVVDQSRRTIVGTGSVLVARDPFKVYTWLARGYYEPNQQIQVSCQTRRIDGKPVPGEAVVRLFKVTYTVMENGGNGETSGIPEIDGIVPVETEVCSETVPLNADGKGTLSFSAAEEGQYRVSCLVTDPAGRTQEGGYVFTVHGSQSKPEASYHFSQLELIPEKEEYAPGEKVRLQVNTDQPDSTVLLFLRPTDGIGLPPEVLSLDGQSKVFEFEVTARDMPNFFVEALTISGGQVYSEQKEIVVPPEKRILNIDILPSQANYRPGDKASAQIKITDMNGKPVVGQTVVSIYDKSVEYISGGGNTEDIKAFFWKWRRDSVPSSFHNLNRVYGNVPSAGEPLMENLGTFGDEIFTLDKNAKNKMLRKPEAGFGGVVSNSMMEMGGMNGMMAGGDMMVMEEAEAAPAEAPEAPQKARAKATSAMADGKRANEIPRQESNDDSADSGTTELVEATVRQNFADTAFWTAALMTDEDGTAQIELEMPENLTTWKIKVWSMGLGTKVGEGETEIITRKDLIIRMQKPRFLVQKDVVTLSANVHNYLSEDKTVQVSLELPENGESAGQDVNVQTDDGQTDKERMGTGQATLAMSGDNAVQTITVPAGGEQRVDWNVSAETAGTAVLLMKALTDEESDAIQDTLPVYVHGIKKMDIVSGMIPPTDNAGSFMADSSVDSSDQTGTPNQTVQASATFEMTVPEERIPDQTALTVRFSPSLAGAIIDALPYLTSYPYGCTEQTLNRFLPTVMTQKALIDMGVDLPELAKKRANLNSQELGDPETRREQWNKVSKNANKNPIYDLDEVQRMTRAGCRKLADMQCSDGGWGWFSGFGEHSSPHLTALVVHGLLLAREADVQVDPAMLNRGINWLVQYQKDQTRELVRGKIWTDEEKQGRWDYKNRPDNEDVFVYYVLTETGHFADDSFNGSDFEDLDEEQFRAKLLSCSEENGDFWNDAARIQSLMKALIWNTRSELSMYTISMLGLALCLENRDTDLTKISQNQKLATNEKFVSDSDKIGLCLRMLSQYLRQDDENQTAWLDLNHGGHWYWWCWYGCEFETQAYYLKLLVQINPKDPVAPRLVKYLLNNRKNGTWWNSTRDTAICIEAFLAYLQQTDEFNPNTVVEVLYDGNVRKRVEITPENMFFIDNTLSLTGDDVTSGKHVITIQQTGNGPIYYNAYLENFSLEDPISSAGLEVKAKRRFYRLERDESATIDVAGGRGQVVSQKVEKYRRVPLENLSEVCSGDLVEVELILESKNDYESLVIEDWKAAGFEPTETQSGYNGNPLGAYVEFRDEKVCFFVSRLTQGEHSVSYRLRAEQPGRFSALPAVIQAMYAPELRGNSDEFKIQVQDVPLEK